jgi:hypothetical protein
MIYTTDWEYNRAARKKQAMAEGKATAARVAVYEARIETLETGLRAIRDAKFYASSYDANCATDNLQGYAARLQMIAAKALGEEGE